MKTKQKRYSVKVIIHALDAIQIGDTITVSVHEKEMLDTIILELHYSAL